MRAKDGGARAVQEVIRVKWIYNWVSGLLLHSRMCLKLVTDLK